MTGKHSVHAHPRECRCHSIVVASMAMHASMRSVKRRGDSVRTSNRLLPRSSMICDRKGMEVLTLCSDGTFS